MVSDEKMQEILMPLCDSKFTYFACRRMIITWDPLIQDLFLNYIKTGVYPENKIKNWNLEEILGYSKYNIYQSCYHLNKIATNPDFIRQLKN